MVLTYSTIFLASLAVALVALYIYKSISSARKSIYRSKQRITNAGSQQCKAAYETAVSPVLPGRKSRVTPGNLSGAEPVVPPVNRGPDTSWPYREDKHVRIGSAYKVRRKAEVPPTRS